MEIVSLYISASQFSVEQTRGWDVIKVVTGLFEKMIFLRQTNHIYLSMIHKVLAADYF